jgi:hypothetical protein
LAALPTFHHATNPYNYQPEINLSYPNQGKGQLALTLLLILLSLLILLTLLPILLSLLALLLTRLLFPLLSSHARCVHLKASAIIKDESGAILYLGSVDDAVSAPH